MIYALIGKLTVRLARILLRRKYGPTLVPKPLLGGVVVLAVGALVVLGRRGDDAE